MIFRHTAGHRQFHRVEDLHFGAEVLQDARGLSRRFGTPVQCCASSAVIRVRTVWRSHRVNWAASSARCSFWTGCKASSYAGDNGSQFTDRFTSNKRDPDGKRIPSGDHVFDVQCKQFEIEHRLIPPRHPQTNGMVERFNGRISEIVNQTRFASAAELESTLRNYVKIYNHNIPQRALKHQTPIQALKKWQQEKPDLFVKRVYNHTGLDT